MEALPVQIMSTPILYPVAIALGFDPIHIGVIIVLFTLVGVITPPVGVCLFVVQQVRGEGSIGLIYRGVIPFCIIMIIMCWIVATFPSMATWLPSLMAGQ